MATLSWDQVFIQANKSVMRAVCVCVCVCVCACARMRVLTWGTKISLHTFLGKTPFPFLPSCIRISHFASMNGWSSGLTNRFHLLFQIWSIYCGCLELWTSPPPPDLSHLLLCRVPSFDALDSSVKSDSFYRPCLPVSWLNLPETIWASQVAQW